MASKPMAERPQSDHGSNAPGNGQRESLSFLSPNDALSTTAITTAPSHPPTASSTFAGRSGASSLLPSPLPPPSASSQSSQHRPHSRVSVVSGLSRDDQSESAAVRKSHSHSISSTPHTLASSKATSSTAADNRERQRAARSLPPWVQSADEDEIA